MLTRSSTFWAPTARPNRIHPKRLPIFREPFCGESPLTMRAAGRPANALWTLGSRPTSFGPLEWDCSDKLCFSEAIPSPGGSYGRYILLLRTKNTYHGEPVRFTGVVTEGNACGAIRSPLRLFGVLLNCKPYSKKQLTIKASHGILPSAKRVWRYLPWKTQQSSPFGIWPTSRCSR